jgi:hypothetical protein
MISIQPTGGTRKYASAEYAMIPDSDPMMSRR